MTNLSKKRQKTNSNNITVQKAVVFAFTLFLIIYFII